MTLKKLKNTLPCFLCMIALLTALAGCIKEDLEDCDDKHALVVRAYDNSGTELGSGTVKDIALFIFDTNNRFVEKMEANVGQSMPIMAPKGETLHIVAWGNLSSGSQTCTDPKPGDLFDDCFITLLQDTRATSHALSPGDLFRGSVTLTPVNKNGETVLPVYRETGSMAVTVRNLKNFAGHDDDNYSIIIRETFSVIGFNDTHSGEKVTYRPDGVFVDSGEREEYSVAPFNLLPGNGLFIDIYHGTQLVATVSQDNSGNPVTVVKGQLTNVLVELKKLESGEASLGVDVSLTDWGKQKVWKEF